MELCLKYDSFSRMDKYISDHDRLLEEIDKNPDNGLMDRMR